ncbi:unnamed protein product [Vicia faba]|uniref:Uncharacterized protein n=1 Tax=Vicia faba TaxID=3906 RepID=A0AAV0ZHM0_VICFA|nr:unnamed protein product [Vicia faba]
MSPTIKTATSETIDHWWATKIFEFVVQLSIGRCESKHHVNVCACPSSLGTTSKHYNIHIPFVHHQDQNILCIKESFQTSMILFLLALKSEFSYYSSSITGVPSRLHPGWLAVENGGHGLSSPRLSSLDDPCTIV